MEGVICQHCGNENQDGATVCVSCRRPLFLLCDACGHANSSIFNYCLNCGKELQKKSAEIAVEAERRFLNVMFCDLVGSTTLSEKLDPEELREIVVAYQDVCAEAIESMGGTIAQYLGDGILVYFGYPVAYENGSQRAVKAALKIIDNIKSLNLDLKKKGQPEISVRIGIHTGLAVIGEIGRGEKRERLALGDTPNIAARVQGLAEPGTVVISIETYKLIQRFFHCEPRGTHLLKGISVPMTIYQPFEQAPSTAKNFISQKATPSALIGRDETINSLMRLWKSSLKNSEEIALLVGEAGMGKSHIIHNFTSGVQEDNPVIVSGKCASLFQNNSFHPLTNILYELAGIMQEDNDGEKLSKLEKFLRQNELNPLPVIPLLEMIHSIPLNEKYEPVVLGATLLREKAFQQFKDILVTLSKKSPLIFLLEDIEWADPSTLQFLQFLADHRELNRIFYLFTFRPEFSASWMSSERAHRFEISALNEKQVKVFAEHLAGNKKFPEELLNLIVSKTNGVPLFIEELMNMILESGMVEVKGNSIRIKGSLPDLAIPSSLQDLLVAKLDQLKDAKEVAQVAAVFGRDFTADLIDAVLNIPFETLLDLLQKLVTSGLMIVKGKPPHLVFSFKHALVQEKAYQLMLKSKRQQYHGIVAEVLEKYFPEYVKESPEFMAHHFSLAGKNKEAIQYWIKAGRTCLEKSAQLEAIICFDKGLSLLNSLPENHERDELEFSLQSGKAPALLATKGYTNPEVEATYARASDLSEIISDRPQLALILRGLWSHYTVKANHKEATRIAKRLEKISEQANDVLISFEAAKALAGSFFWRGEFVRAKNILEQALKKFDPEIHYKHIYLYSEHPVVSCHTYQSFVLSSLGYNDQAIKSATTAIDYAKKLNHPFTITYALGFAAITYQMKKDVATTFTFAREAEELGKKYGFLFWQSMGTILKNWALMESGSPDGLKKMEVAVKEARSRGQQLWVSNPLCLIAEAYGKNGQPEKGLEILNDAFQISEKNDDLFYSAELHRIKGFLLQQSGRANEEEVEKTLRRAFDISQKQSAKNYELRATCDIAKMKERQGKHEEGRKLLLKSLEWFPADSNTVDLLNARKLLNEFTGMKVK